MKKLLVFSAVMLLLAYTAALSMPIQAQTTSIQGLINAASPGSTITVPAGTYFENVTVNKQLTLMGNNVVISGGSGIQVTSSNVHIEGFTVRSAYIGVYLANVTDCTITNCDLSNNGYGVYGDYASHNTISKNTMTRELGGATALGDGIFFNFGDSNIVTENILSSNNAFGISCSASPNNQISGNTIKDNTRIGVRLGPASNDNSVFSNTISGNGLETNITSLASTFPACGILVVESALNNHIYDNKFNNQPVQIIGSYIASPKTNAPTESPPPTPTEAPPVPINITRITTDPLLLTIIVALVLVLVGFSFVIIYQYYNRNNNNY